MQDQPNNEQIIAVIAEAKKRLRANLTELNSLNAPIGVLRNLIEAISIIDLSYQDRPMSGLCGAAMIHSPTHLELPSEMRQEIESIVRSQIEALSEKQEAAA